MAIDKGTTAAASLRNDRILRVWSLNLDETIEIDLDDIGPGCNGKWSDYVEGVAAALKERGAALAGADIALNSDVSIGGGLSSSAALEMALGTALTGISGISMNKLDLALAGQAAEHNHVGIQCGIMDQFISVHALEGHALLLDCRSLQAKPVPLHLQDFQMVICDSRVRHALASSEYNLRRQDCRTGVELLKAAIPGIKALRDVAMDELDSHQSLLPEIVYRRCRHVIGENARTVKAAEALEKGDLAAMGKLMSASHQSLRDDYQVSCREIDLLAQCAEEQPGVLGARMTGGGFGGCTVNLVKKSEFESFSENVARIYQSEMKIAPEILAVQPSAGAREA
jgi:galactokinase